MRTEQLIRESNGRIFTVEFIKKNGDLRRMRARLGVRKGLKGTGMRYDPLARGLLPVWDTQKQGYRMINLRTLRSLRVNGTNYQFVENTDHYPERTRTRPINRPRTRYSSSYLRTHRVDPNDCSHKTRVGCIHLPEGESWRVDVFTDKTCKVGCTAFGQESTKNVYELLGLIFKN